jgi:branched-chain amino acid aminotransferase
MAEAVFEYFIHNDNTIKVSEFERYYNDIYPSVYEVIRIMNGVPVFLEEHYERLLNSTKILNFSLKLSLDDMKVKIERMVKLNNIKDYNIKIVFNNLSKPEHDEYYYFIKTSYPSSDQYRIGVETFLYNAERQNPNAKVIYKNMRDQINKLLSEKNCFEALLVNSKNEITEGSLKYLLHKGQ